MMRNFDELVKTNHNTNWPYIPNNPYRILVLDGSRSDKINASMNLIKYQQPGIVKIHFAHQKSLSIKVYIAY